jgi:hypothetical protein
MVSACTRMLKITTTYAAATIHAFECIAEPRHQFDMKGVFSRCAAIRACNRILNQPGFGGYVLDEEYGNTGIVRGMCVRWRM